MNDINWGFKAGEALLYLAALLGLNRWVTHDLKRRVDKLEAEPMRSVADCMERMAHCPTGGQLGGLITWMERVEKKMDLNPTKAEFSLLTKEIEKLERSVVKIIDREIDELREERSALRASERRSGADRRYSRSSSDVKE
jgi:hypothetical protein